MSTTAKKTTKKTALSGAVKTEKKEEIFYDENGKRISKTMYGLLQYWRKPGKTAILDMRAVLK